MADVSPLNTFLPKRFLRWLRRRWLWLLGFVVILLLTGVSWILHSAGQQMSFVSERVRTQLEQAFAQTPTGRLAYWQMPDHEQRTGPAWSLLSTAPRGKVVTGLARYCKRTVILSLSRSIDQDLVPAKSNPSRLLWKTKRRAISPLLDNTNGRPVYLAGHSLGGPLVAKMAALYPEKVDGLVILAGSFDPTLEKENTLLDSIYR